MPSLDSLPKWMRTNKLFRAKLKPGLGKQSFDPSWDDERRIATWEEANLVSSEVFEVGGTVWHMPSIDLDLEAAIIPSSTPGHNHLYINKPMKAKQYRALLTALWDAGIIEHGILEQFDRHGSTTLRLPHIKKEPAVVTETHYDKYGNVTKVEHHTEVEPF